MFRKDFYLFPLFFSLPRFTNMPSRQAANPAHPFSSKSHSCPSSSHFPNFPQPPKSLPRITSGLSNSPVDWIRGWRREKKRRGEGNSPSGFKLELEVLGIEVMDADVAILTPTAVAAGRKGESQECCWEQRMASLVSPPPPETDTGITKGKKKDQ